MTAPPCISGFSRGGVDSVINSIEAVSLVVVVRVEDRAFGVGVHKASGGASPCFPTSKRRIGHGGPGHAGGVPGWVWIDIEVTVVDDAPVGDIIWAAIGGEVGNVRANHAEIGGLVGSTAADFEEAGAVVKAFGVVIFLVV